LTYNTGDFEHDPGADGTGLVVAHFPVKLGRLGHLAAIKITANVIQQDVDAEGLLLIVIFTLFFLFCSFSFFFFFSFLFFFFFLQKLVISFGLRSSAFYIFVVLFSYYYLFYFLFYFYFYLL
jgi:hypothetical protein